MPLDKLLIEGLSNRLFGQTICPSYAAHPRFSGEAGVEHILRLYLSPLRVEGRGKVVLEHLTLGRNPEIHNINVHQTLEEALEAVTFDPRVPQLAYEWLLADLSRNKLR
jgi:hypothetical protein